MRVTRARTAREIQVGDKVYVREDPVIAIPNDGDWVTDTMFHTVTEVHNTDAGVTIVAERVWFGYEPDVVTLTDLHDERTVLRGESR